MEGYRTTSSRLLVLSMAVFMAIAMAAAAMVFTPTQQAQAATNQLVQEQRAGVFKFNWGIDGHSYARGSAFLINEDTIVTAYHCVMPSSAELSYFGLTQQDVLDRSTYTVDVPGGFQVSATLEKPSEEQDMAILKLDQKLNNVKALKLLDSRELDASEQVYALGFPASADQNAIITFTSNDVAIFDGTITKPEGQMAYTDNTLAKRSGSFLITTCRMDGGTSGGPMVDENGNVVGVCVAGDSNFFYASASDVLMQALDTMAYSYTKATGPDPKPVKPLDFSKLNSAIGRASAMEESTYTKESYARMQEALTKANDALKTEVASGASEDEFNKAQKSVDDATDNLNSTIDGLEKAPQGPDPVMIAIIAVAAIVVIAVIIAIILVTRSRKKKERAAAEAAAAPSPVVSGGTGVQPALNTGASQSWQKVGTGAHSISDVSETTILDEKPTDTILLFQAASGGSLTRMSTNEQIPINSTEFVIGRERSKVDYCLEGNDAIGRMHVRIVVRDGDVFCVDNHAKNGTYVNGVKCRPGEEVQLKNGDIIMLADEKFKYNS